MVSVRDGNIYVTSANALVVKESTIALRIDTSLNAPPDFQRAQPVTILYTGDDRVLRLKAVVRERIDDVRLTVEPVGDVKEGDRRDYRRVDMDVQLHVSDVATMEAAERSEHLASGPTGTLEKHAVNISGSGVQWTGSHQWAHDQLVLIEMGLGGDGDDVIRAIGQVVRSIEVDDGHQTAVRFVEISESAQDKIVHAVFACFFQSGAAKEFVDLDDGVSDSE
jgi:c-di-GMP-binding flagellar brake protein YcgR